jgi:hypothetical protein
MKCIEKQDEKNGEDIFTMKKIPCHNLYQAILTASLLLDPLQGSTEGVTGALLRPGGERLPPTCVNTGHKVQI